ncbi:hypothetical protein LTR09_004963 [Extremus antarcticus]|uniref:Uncharacterized protein n=1 Tax=Extremus antarcticus TaxID=702011 RepID=A0AAJ0DHG4_9PEZI|nr:hypothetical protein LTR09_004963 [Extremus antarcticus]
MHDRWLRLVDFVSEYYGLYQRKKITTTARYQGQVQRDWLVGECNKRSVIAAIVAEAYQWYEDKRDGIRVDCDVLVEKVGVVQPEEEGNETKALTPAPSTGRKTPTDSALAVIAAKEANGGTVAASLYLK